MVLDIRSARQVSRMRQRDLAAAAGISVNELMKLERGLVIASEKLLRQISNCLGIDVDQIAVAQSKLFANPLTGEGYVTARPESTQTIPRRKSLDYTKKTSLIYSVESVAYRMGLRCMKNFKLSLESIF
jgi:DNA (cytosine-5)-methyltransferase 1